MVITPTLRGLFGISIDAQSKTITVNPHLPASWDHAELHNLRIGNDNASLAFTRTGGTLIASLDAPAGIKLASTASDTKQLGANKVSIPLPAIEVGDVTQYPIPGDRAHAPRVLSETYQAHQFTLSIEGTAGSDVELPLVENAPKLRIAVHGAELKTDKNGARMLSLQIPQGEEWQTKTVTLTW